MPATAPSTLVIRCSRLLKRVSTSSLNASILPSSAWSMLKSWLIFSWFIFLLECPVLLEGGSLSVERMSGQSGLPIFERKGPGKENPWSISLDANQEKWS
jgi:hypothetical protein